MKTEIPMLSPGQEVYLKKATALTFAQIKAAQDLIAYTNVNPNLLGHVLQALATNYAAAVEAVKD